MSVTKSEVPKFKLTLNSRNHKTGNMPVSTSPMQTCPTTCPFRGRGCYGNYGPLFAWWKKCSHNPNSTASDYRSFLNQVIGLSEGQLWRHNQAGDLLSLDNERIDIPAAFHLIEANRGKRGFTYTHYGVIEQHGTSAKAAEFNRGIIELMNKLGFVVNVSCNSLAHADRVIASGINAPITVLVPEKYALDGKKSFKTPAGNRVVMCPNITKNLACTECLACMRHTRKPIIAFPCHGSGKKRAEEVIREWESGDYQAMDHEQKGTYKLRHTYHAGIDGLEDK